LQALRRLICLRTDCHTTTHFGLASINGKSTEAYKHLCTNTGLPANQQALKVPTEDPSWSGLDTLFSARRTPGPAAILQPPKPSIAPSTRILQRAAEHDVEPEAGG
jgi:hypothetical protein